MREPPARTNLILSQLVRKGWAVRVRQGRYRLLQPAAVVALEKLRSGPPNDSSLIFRKFQHAVSEVFSRFGPDLVS
ncbi:MAG: hypothetical protein WCA77_10050, partial [Thermoplasmata archaeon]